MQERLRRNPRTSCYDCQQEKAQHNYVKRNGRERKFGERLRRTLDSYMSGPELSELAEKVLNEYGFVRKDKG